jgi:hypothetical protein
LDSGKNLAEDGKEMQTLFAKNEIILLAIPAF